VTVAVTVLVVRDEGLGVTVLVVKVEGLPTTYGLCEVTIPAMVMGREAVPRIEDGDKVTFFEA